LKIEPKNIIIWRELGNIQTVYPTYDLSKAKAAWKKAIEIEPENPENAHVYSALGYYNSMRSPKNGLPFYSKAVELDPSNPFYYFKRAQALNDKGEYQEAIADYSKAIEIDSQYADSYNNRGLAKEELGDYLGAIADYSKAIKIGSQKGDDFFAPRTYQNRGIAKRKLRDNQGACIDVKKARSLGYRPSVGTHSKGYGSPEWFKSKEGDWCLNMK